jgi:hypothetical protein
VKARNLQVVIEELVLRGFPAEAGGAIAEGLRAELERRLGTAAAGETLPAGRNASFVDAGAFPVSPGTGATEIGGAAARAIAEHVK